MLPEINILCNMDSTSLVSSRLQCFDCWSSQHHAKTKYTLL